MPGLIAFVFGLIVGSFLNVCIVRLPQNKSIAWPGSHCPKCKHVIRWFDNIPVVSFLILKGRCRDCSQTMSAAYPIVEMLGGAAALWAYFAWGLSAYSLMAAVILWSLIVVIWVDYRHQIIPDQISIGGIVAGVLFSFFYPAWHGTAEGATALVSSALGILVGGGFLWGTALLVEAVIKKEALGGGDIKYMAAVGAFFGWEKALFAIFLGSLAGSVASVVNRTGKGVEIPFGPYLAVGTVIAWMWGDSIIGWYLATVLQY